MKKHDNDYSVSVFFADVKVKKWGFVHKLSSFKTFLDAKHKGWEYMNVYDRRTGTYLKRFYNLQLPPDFLQVAYALAFFVNL